MTRMNSKLSAIVLVAAVLTTAACGTATATTPSGPASSAAVQPSTKPAAPTPTFADPTQGSGTTVVKLHSFDAGAGSAVVEPIIFMDGPAYCKAFKLKSSDGRCQREWVSEESHTKITLPVLAKPKLTTWDDHQGGDCIGSMTGGGTCPATAAEFAEWLKQDPGGFAVITTKDGTITHIAQMYTP